MSSDATRDQDWLYALSVYVAENLELLGSIEPRLLMLEKLSPESDELIRFLNDLFRLFHSLKGGAASFDLNVIRDVTHQMENLLDFFRKNRIKIQPNHVDLFNLTSDFIKNSFTYVSTNYNDAIFEKESVSLIELIQEEVKNLEVSFGDASLAQKAEIKKPSSPISMEKGFTSLPVTGLLDQSYISVNGCSADFKVLVTSEIKLQLFDEGEKIINGLSNSFSQLKTPENCRKNFSSSLNELNLFSCVLQFFGFQSLFEIVHKLQIVSGSPLIGLSENFEETENLFNLLVKEVRRNLKSLCVPPGFIIPSDPALEVAFKTGFEDFVSRTLKGLQSLPMLPIEIPKDQLFNNLDEMKININPEMIAEFAKLAEEIFDAIGTALEVVEKRPSAIDKIEKAMNGFHSFIGLSTFFGFRNLIDVSKLAEIALFNMIKNPVVAANSPVNVLKNTLSDLRKSVNQLAITGKSENVEKISAINQIDDFLVEVQKKLEMGKLLLPTTSMSEIFDESEITKFRDEALPRLATLNEILGKIEKNLEEVYLLDNFAMETQLFKESVTALIWASKRTLPGRHPLQILRILAQGLEIFAGKALYLEEFSLETSSLEVFKLATEEIQTLLNSFFARKISVEVNRKLFSALSINFSFFRETDLAFLDSAIKKLEFPENQTEENINEYLRCLENITLACKRLNREDIIPLITKQKDLLNSFLNASEQPFSPIFEELKKVYDEMVEKTKVGTSFPSKPIAPTKVQPTATTLASSANASSKGTLRVDEEKIDHLLTIVGEIFVTCESFSSLEKQLLSTHDLDFLSKKMKEVGMNFSNLSSDLEKGLMTIRLVPLQSFFQRFPRLVRDLAKKLGKEVNLQISGEENEVDKRTLEKLTDPLIHILRNSVDHGVEMPEARKTAGKPLEGLVKLSAKIENETIYFDIADDGKGLDAEILKRKAIEKGILDPEKAATMSEKEAFDLIFLPGFSTAEKITDVSGRGVGMDVVKSNIQQLQGKIDISSKIGQGSVFRIEVPVQKLCLMIFQTVFVKAGESEYLISMENVGLLSEIPMPHLHTYGEMRFADVFGRLYPFMFLEEILQTRSKTAIMDEKKNEKDIAVLLLRTSRGEFALGVDRFISEERVVVKPLKLKFVNTPLIAGTAILGNGTIAIVIESENLATSFSNLFGFEGDLPAHIAARIATSSIINTGKINHLPNSSSASSPTSSSPPPSPLPLSSSPATSEERV
ncbi:MAG: Hpt domain-containing protein [Candidatus Riflebacteria bacterium]|nr:Hpt domain-containing protein [Candidatus Riflebacteria bacterium]